LKTVVHNDDARSGGGCEFCSRDSIAGDDRRGKARQQKRLVADIGSAMDRRIDADRASEPPAIAAAQKERALAGGVEELRDRQSRRSFPGPADGEIAQADNWQAGVPGSRPHAQSRHGAVNRCQRRQRRACSGSPPEGRLAHQIGRPDTLPVIRVPQAEAGSDKDRGRPRCDRAHRRAL